MPGYYRTPTIHSDTIVFRSEDDLWTVPAKGGIARRLTTNLATVARPYLSPDGQLLAFTGSEEGPGEVYVMPALGGEARRLTYQGVNADVAGWAPDGNGILYSSGAGRASSWSGGQAWIWRVAPTGGEPQELPYGPARHIAFGPDGGVVLGRWTADPARWKRYRGGLCGRLWIDADGSGDFQPLLPANGNLASPMWIGERIYFLSDHEGIGNLYSCLPDGADLRRHTHQDTYYARNASTDGKRIVYHAGADLFVYDVESDKGWMVDVDYRSAFTQRQRKFAETGRYLHEFALHPDGHALNLTVRGKLFTMANWEGAALQHGERDGVRYQMSDWLNDGKRLVTVSDAGGEEALEIHTRDGSAEPLRLDGLDIGRPVGLEVSPKKDEILLLNHRHELQVINLETRELRVLDRSPYNGVAGAAWSPDGRWIAYGFASTERTISIKICQVETGETWLVTPPEFTDVSPAWDPEGKYLYFLSFREFNPVYDQLNFDLGFPLAMRPMLVTLRKDLLSPFVPVPKPFEEKKEEKKEGKGAEGENQSFEKSSEEGKEKSAEGEKKDEKEKPVEIDFENISRRVVAFPYPEGQYWNIAGIEGKALFVSAPMRATLGHHGSEPDGTLHVYDFKEHKKDTLVSGINHFILSRDAKTLAYRAGEKLRALKAGDKPNDEAAKEGPNRQGGWVDLNRVKCSVDFKAEWRQMYRETFRFQREHFWTADMSGVDWQLIYDRYLPLLERVGTRGEFSDLMWEMQGELGTSHCYEFGGDYRPSPHYGQGFLGADFVYDPALSVAEGAEMGGYRITHIAHGDPWEESKDSPLAEPGINVREGDALLAVNGVRLTPERSPGEPLVNQGGQEVELTVLDAEKKEKRVVTVKTLTGEYDLRYREWVAKNRSYVHERTNGQVGYFHIPDMGARGYAEFHRGYLAELDYPSIIVDVRFNGGGHVSPLLLEKLARKRIGYDVRRWGTPIAYPYESVMGHLVAVTNEAAGSDGDMFSHAFKLMKLGLLIGKRTWGGVIGIDGKHRFVDGGGTTQPEYSFWFSDVGWGVENYGTDPDIEVDYYPQDYVAGRDPQLDRAITEILRLIEERPPRLPDFHPRPRLPLPTLPK